MSKGLFVTLFEAGEPFALIDTRERREHVNGHWFGSTNIPLSVLKPQTLRLIPDRDFPIHLLDWQDKPGEAAATLLSESGYTNVTRCTTRQPDAFGDGFVKGEFVWSKAFGEVVAHTSGLPEITPAEYLANYRQAQLFDVRPTAEYSLFTIPGSQSLPNSLLLANMETLKQTGHMALLHCAGRTRSIIGACTLKAAGYNGPYAIFKGGTQAWQLDGLEREFNATRLFAKDTDTEEINAEEINTREIKCKEIDDLKPIKDFLDQWNIEYQFLDNANLENFIAKHTTEHLFDVSDDAATGQLAECNIVKISGTNLIQQTDRSIARYHVPVILFDHGSGSRAAFAAYWLQTMGFKVSIVYLTKKLASRPPDDPGIYHGHSTTNPVHVVLTTDQLLKIPESTDTLIDLRPSQAYSRGHIKGSHWGNISELLLRDAHATKSTVVIGNDVEHASHCADLLAHNGWQIAGIYGWNTGDIDTDNFDPVDIHDAQLHTTTIESPIDKSALFAARHHGNMQDSRDYLAWEEELPDQIDREVYKLWLQLLGNTVV